MNRRVRYLGAAVVAALAVVGCGGTTAGPAATPDNSPAAFRVKVIARVWAASADPSATR